jgi:translation initiation factor eIF-2B subunit beta
MHGGGSTACSSPLPRAPRSASAGTLHVPNPTFDYIPPHLISLFITDTGGYTPSYVYRLLSEHYSREDYLLSKALCFNDAC